MSYLFRPTPVVNLGRGAFASQNVISGWTGAQMRGMVPGWNYSPGLGRVRAAKTSLQPWLKTSGTMGSFIPNGLGGLGDDFGLPDPTSIDLGIDPSVLTPPTVPFDPSTLVPSSAGSVSYSPIGSTLMPPSSLNQPPLLLVPTSAGDTSSAPIGSTLAPPPAAAGPTGTGIPGTQPLNLVAQAAPSLITSLSSALKSWFTPKPSVPNYTQLPGYGGVPTTGASFLTQSTIAPGVPNIAILGLAVLAVALVTSGGGKR